MSFTKKTIELDEKAVKRARKIFAVDTDKEAVNLALYLVGEEDDIITTHEKLSGTIEIEDIFG